MKLFKTGEKIYRYKDFYFAIGGKLYWVKWFKNGLGQGFIFHEIIPALVFFGEFF